MEGIRKSDLEVNKECLPFSMYIGGQTVDSEAVRELDIGGEFICKLNECGDIMVWIPDHLKTFSKVNASDNWLKQEEFIERMIPLLKRALNTQIISALARDCLKQTKGE